MKYREVVRRLRRLGCEESGTRVSGSHRKWYNPTTGGIATVPDWGAKDIKDGTLHAIVKDLGLDWQEFLKAR